MPQNTQMNHRRRSILIDVFVAVAAVSTLGMLFDSWIVVWLSIPAFAAVMLLQGALDQEDRWNRSALTAVIAFCAVLAALFIAVVLTEGSDVRWWGLPVSMALIVFVIWPYTAIVAGLLYAFVFDRSLRHDVVSTT